jgi:hypothetical protein
VNALVPAPRSDTRPVSAASALAAFHAGRLTATAMLAAIRASVLLTPVTGDQEVLATRSRGVIWLVAFTSPQALAVYARRRREGDRMWDYASVRGARLLGPMLAGVPGRSGVALDLGSPHPLLLPADATTQNEEMNGGIR